MPLLTEYVRRRRYAAIQPFIQGAVLDIGCGIAVTALSLEAAHRYVGVDVNAALVVDMRRRFPQYEFHCCDVDREPLPVGDQRFNTVLLVAVLEHLTNPGWVLEQVADCLHPAGRLVITTPTPLGLRLHRWGARLGLFHPHAAEEHQRAYERRALETLLAAHGFRVVLYRRFELGANQLVVGRMG